MQPGGGSGGRRGGWSGGQGVRDEAPVELSVWLEGREHDIRSMKRGDNGHEPFPCSLQI